MMLQIKGRGFTLIELLVVIAIIGILASVVLASLNNARDKGEDATTKQQLSSIRAEAELSYDTRGRTYASVCTDVAGLYSNLSLGATCQDSVNGYTVTAELREASGGATQYFCVDSLGRTATTGTAVASGSAWQLGTHECAQL